MAKLWITEFQKMENANDIGGVPQVAKLPGTTQVVTFTTTTQSTAFAYNTRFVRVTADADCHIAYGSNPTATTSSLRMAAETVEYFGVNPGDKIAAVTA